MVSSLCGGVALHGFNSLKNLHASLHATWDMEIIQFEDYIVDTVEGFSPTFHVIHSPYKVFWYTRQEYNIVQGISKLVSEDNQPRGSSKEMKVELNKYRLNSKAMSVVPWTLLFHLSRKSSTNPPLIENDFLQCYEKLEFFIVLKKIMSYQTAKSNHENGFTSYVPFDNSFLPFFSLPVRSSSQYKTSKWTHLVLPLIQPSTC